MKPAFEGGSAAGALSRRGVHSIWFVPRIVGPGLLVATGAIHLDLYLTGYRSIPTIGWLFLVQVIAAFGLGLGFLVSDSRLASVAGAGFALSTLGGYLLSLRIGLFGFREVRTASGIVAGIIEILAVAVLAMLALGATPPRQPRGPATQGTAVGERQALSLAAARWVSVALVTLAAVLFAVSVAVSGPTSTNAGSGTAIVKIARINGVPVLTHARGFTLYWFVPDSPTRSTCYGTCAVYWPPVTGSPVAAQAVAGTLGTITRSGGATQVTYDRHPLYTYVGDSALGQANGNDIDLNGGVWHEMTESGK